MLLATVRPVATIRVSVRPYSLLDASDNGEVSSNDLGIGEALFMVLESVMLVVLQLNWASVKPPNDFGTISGTGDTTLVS